MRGIGAGRPHRKARIAFKEAPDDDDSNDTRTPTNSGRT